MTDNPRNEADPLWSAIQGAFSPERAFYFRNYPISVEHTVREVDYIIFHRTRTVFVVFAESTQDDELRSSPTELGEGISVYDEFTGDTRTYYPASIARSILRSLAQRDLQLERFVIVIWLPNARLRNESPISESVDRDVIFLDSEDISSEYIRSLFEAKTGDLRDRGFSDDQWENLRWFLNPSSPIQNKTPRRNRIEQEARAKSLADRYLNNYNRSTLIFISYRRDDSGWSAGRIYGHLSSVFEGIIFFDYSSIKPGALWIDAIEQALEDCIVQLVIIGPNWTTLTSPGSSIPRIMESKDMVAHEIRMAFRKKVITIPMLIDHDKMPRAKDLPTGLKQLPTRNAMLINQDNFFPKMDFLVDRIIELLEFAHP